ncbi:hypothetical protein [Parendozoicomonas sp. Alg238-R29]|uniref:hypothetical protein n=1 Tax=Parendozoicomonas sp. Alg238-R29 TaxID=2993446 RepID=UPI00248E4410|nr:hypothetical protein [Parendozoicomonas sp. Alg238-R29]
MELQVDPKPQKHHSKLKVPTVKDKSSDNTPKHLPEKSQDVWSRPKCSERKVEWVKKRQELVQPRPEEGYKIPESITPEILDREFDQLCDELEDFSLEGYFASEEFGLDSIVLYQRILAAEKDDKERLSLERDVAGFINKLTHAFVSPNKDIAAAHFTTCMEEFRRVTKALPKSEYARSLIKKSVDSLADQMDLLTKDVRKHCIRQTYRYAGKDKTVAKCSTEEQRNQIQAVQDLLAFEEYQLDINNIISEVTSPSQPGESSDEGEGEEALSGSDSVQMRPEAQKKTQQERERETREDKNYREATAAVGDIERCLKELEERHKQAELDKISPWQKLLARVGQNDSGVEANSLPPSTVSLPVEPHPATPSTEKIKEAFFEPVPPAVDPSAPLYPSLDDVVTGGAEKPDNKSLSLTPETLPPDPSMLVQPVRTKRITKTNKKFGMIEQRKQEVSDAQGDKEKMAAVTGKMVIMADAMNKNVVEKTREIAKKPLSKDKIISKTGHLVGVRAIQDEIVPPETRHPEVMDVNDKDPGKPANIHCTLVKLLEQPVVRRYDSPSDISPDLARSWSLQQLQKAFEKEADRFSEPQRKCIRKHLRTLKSFLENRSYPFSYFSNMATPVQLPEEPFRLISKSLYDEWIGFPMVSYRDYAKIHSFDEPTLSRFLTEIFSKTTMEVLESLFPNKAGIKGIVKRGDLCSKPRDAFDVGCVTHTNGIRIAMLYSPTQRSHYLAVRERGRESVIRCEGENTSEYLGRRRSTNIAYENIGVSMI